MKSEAQGKKQRFSRYKQSLRSSLLAFWGRQKEQQIYLGSIFKSFIKCVTHTLTLCLLPFHFCTTVTLW